MTCFGDFVGFEICVIDILMVWSSRRDRSRGLCWRLLIVSILEAISGTVVIDFDVCGFIGAVAYSLFTCVACHC